MSKLDNFKKFVSLHPEFITYINENKTSWQSLYELYDIYGENNDIWKRYLNKESNTTSIKGILNAFKGINIDSLEENINQIEKAISLVKELTTEEEHKQEVEPKENKIDKLYGD